MEVFKNYRCPSWKGPIALRPHPAPRWCLDPRWGPWPGEQSKPGAGVGAGKLCRDLSNSN